MSRVNNEPETGHNQHIAAFDTLFTQYPLQICKIILPLLPPRYQGFLSVYIKFQELVFTLTFFQEKMNRSNTFLQSSWDNPPEAITEIIHEIKPYCSPSIQQSLDQMEQMLQAFDRMKAYMPLLDAMNQSDSADSSSLFNTFMNRDQKNMYQKFENFFND